MQKYIVSTTIGAEGLDFKDDVNILLADGAHAFAERVVEAISDQALRDRIRSRGGLSCGPPMIPGHSAADAMRRSAASFGKPAAVEEPRRIIVDLRSEGRRGMREIESFPGLLLDHLAELDRVNRYTVLASAETRSDLARRAPANITVAPDGASSRWRTATMAAVRALHRRLGTEYGALQTWSCCGERGRSMPRWCSGCRASSTRMSPC